MRNTQPRDAALVAAIEAAIGGRRRGSDIVFRCPVHDDRTPSARWHVERHVWFCDPCGIGGGAVDLAGQLGIEVGRRLLTDAKRRAIAARQAERLERSVLLRTLRASWFAALAELRDAQDDVVLVRALLRDDIDERDPRTTALLDSLGDPFVRELCSEQRLDVIENLERATHEGVRRVA